MFLKTKNRKALSAVLTTLIILVASVVLGTGVVLFGTSLFQTNSQSSGLAVQGVHVWVNSTSGTATPWAWGAAEIRNSGDKILSVDQIQVRGTQVPFANWYVDSDPNRVTVANYQTQLIYTGTGNPNTSPTTVGMMTSTNSTSLSNCKASVSTTIFAILEANSWSTNTPTLCFSQATGPISLKPGDRAIVYFQVPVGILNTVDGGSNSNVAIYSGSVGSPQSVTIEAKS